MSTLFYGSPPGTIANQDGNAGVLLTRVQLLDYRRIPVWSPDGADYLGTIHRLQVRGIFNPEVNAYDFMPARPTGAAPFSALGSVDVDVAAGGQTRDRPIVLAVANNAVPLAGVGTPTVATAPGQSRGGLAPWTDLAVREWLMQPRRQLVYAVGGVPVLTSPGMNADGTVASCDMYNGPVPLECSVRRVSGTKTFVVDYSVETYLNESYLWNATPSVLLSHRWNVAEDIDQDLYQTRVINGFARFRSDRLAFLGAVPDDFRVALWHPLPSRIGWKRTVAHIEAAEDGSTLTYTLVDRQLALSVVPEGVTRVEAFQAVGSNLVNTYSLGKSGAGLLGSIFEQLASPIASRRTGGVPAGKVPGAVGLFGSSLMEADIPQTQCDITVRVWGSPTSWRSDLQNVAIGIVLARLNLAGNLIKNFSATEFSLTHDLAGSFVEANCMKRTAVAGAPWTFSGGLKAQISALPNVGQYFPTHNDDTEGYLEVKRASALQGQGGLTRQSAAGVATRGAYIVRLATAALLNPYAVPQSPPAPAPVSVSPASDGVVADRSPP